MNNTIKVVCGSNNYGGQRVVWALSLMDMRVYINNEATNIDTLALELDDFLGYEPPGYSWDFVLVDNNKRVAAWVNRTQALINKQKEDNNE
jgi:hypothetical protein